MADQADQLDAFGGPAVRFRSVPTRPPAPPAPPPVQLGLFASDAGELAGQASIDADLGAQGPALFGTGG